MTVDWTINLGSIISLMGSVLVMLGGSVSIYISWRNHAAVTDTRLDNLVESVKGLREDMRPMREALVSIAVQDERFKLLERRIEVVETRVMMRLEVDR